MVPPDTHLRIGSLLFEDLDQIDLTGPFGVLSRIPNSTYRIYSQTTNTVRDLKELRLTADATPSEAPRLDVLHIPGGFGQEAVMGDEEILSRVREQAASAHSFFSVCTGALICSAAGLLEGRRATPLWASSCELLPYFHAIPINKRVVVDGNWVFAAGVTAGIDRAETCRRIARSRNRACDLTLYGLCARTAIPRRYAGNRPFRCFDANQSRRR